MKRIWDVIKMMIKLIIIGGFILLTIMLLINLWVIFATNQQIVEPTSIKHTHYQEDTPLLVLGAGIIDAQTPSNILEKRLDKAILLQQLFPNKKLIMSGDHQDLYYNEVAVMKNYVVAKGIKSEQVYLDHAGYSTYDSLYRLKHVLGQDKVIIVTQRYHLSRALMLAKGLGIDAIGVAADEVESTRFEREFREIFARIKDFAVTYFHYQLPTPELNYAIDLTQSGDYTNDKMSLYQ